MPSTDQTTPSIIAVDDDPLILQLVEAALWQDAQVTGFLRPDLAAPLVSQTSLLVLDLNIPQYDTIEFLAGLADHDLTPPLLLISGMGANTLENSRRMAQQLKFTTVEILQKPFNAHQLQEKVVSLRKGRSFTHTFNRGASNASGMTLEAFEEALDRHLFMCHFQAQIDLDTAKIRGVEALARCRVSAEDVLGPAHFMALAASPRFASRFFIHILEAAMSEYRQTFGTSHQDISLSVNLAPAALEDPELFEKISHLLYWNNFDRHQLTLEITEQGADQFSKTALSTIARAQIAGIDISIDDFGTGSSGLHRLRSLGFDEVKIDKSFVDGICRSTQAQIILSHMTRLAHDLTLKTVLEGVETKPQLQWLQENFGGLGIIIQGFIFARPVAGDTLHALLRENHGVFQNVA